MSICTTGLGQSSRIFSPGSHQHSRFPPSLNAGVFSGRLPPTGISSDIFSWICWNIWTARNNLFFENRHISASTVMTNTISGAREWLVAQESCRPLHQVPPLCQPPTHFPPEVTPCNSDAAWKNDSLTAGLGWVIHCDRAGQQIQGSSWCDSISSPLLAEAIALKMTLLAAQSFCIPKVWIRDSQGLIRAINSKSYPMEIFGVLMDIEFLSASFDFICFSFIPRDQNSVADFLAKAALRNASHAMY